MVRKPQQETIIESCSDWYTGRWRVGYDIWYTEELASGRTQAWCSIRPSAVYKGKNTSATNCRDIKWHQYVFMCLISYYQRRPASQVIHYNRVYYMSAILNQWRCESLWHPHLAMPLSWLSVGLRDACGLPDVKVTHYWANISWFLFLSLKWRPYKMPPGTNTPSLPPFPSPLCWMLLFVIVVANKRRVEFTRRRINHCIEPHNKQMSEHWRT